MTDATETQPAHSDASTAPAATVPAIRPISVLYDDNVQRHVRLDQGELTALDEAMSSVREMLEIKERRAGIIRETSLGASDPLVAATLWQVAEDHKVRPRDVVHTVLRAWAEDVAPRVQFNCEKGLDAETEQAWQEAKAERERLEADIAKRREKALAFKTAQAGA